MYHQGFPCEFCPNPGNDDVDDMYDMDDMDAEDDFESAALPNNATLDDDATFAFYPEASRGRYLWTTCDDVGLTWPLPNLGYWVDAASYRPGSPIQVRRCIPEVGERY